ncbi:MAG: BON domain-containing protein [Sphaerospermopsis sp. SIO1G2]|nr:BON domain-containing protein [Sphaerospermopsis sp. SIO1G2]
MRSLYISLLSTLLITGCTTAVVGGVSAVGLGALEERSLGDNLDDRSISAEIHQLYLKENVESLLKDVSIRVHEERVLLTGKTATPAVALEAVRLAWQAAGVREVINEIHVGEDGTSLLNYAQDNLIETQIEARLLGTKEINSLNYTVEVVDGTAYMLGVAQDEQERHNAAYIASITNGVQRVVSYVRLKDDPRRLSVTGKLRGDDKAQPSRDNVYE